MGQYVRRQSVDPSKKSETLEQQVSAPPVLTSDLKGAARWQAIYDLAVEAGQRAMEECVPEPLVVDGDVYMEGDCGGARIVVHDARTRFARWLKTRETGHRHYRSGYAVSAHRIGQSAETAKAYADAFARVLIRNGISCTVETYLT